MCVVGYKGFCCFFKQNTAYELRIIDWSSDVCSSDLLADERRGRRRRHVGKLLSLAQHAVRLFDDGVAQRGEADDAAGALDERLTEQLGSAAWMGKVSHNV